MNNVKPVIIRERRSFCPECGDKTYARHLVCTEFQVNCKVCGHVEYFDE